jgi:hypothetical protein
VLVVALLGLGLSWALVQPSPDDREALEDLVLRAKHAFEQRSTAEIMSCVATDYQDSSGLTRDQVYQIVQRLTRGSQEINVTITSQEIQARGATAVGHFTVQAQAREGDELVNWPMDLEVQFVKQRQGAFHLWRRSWVVKSVNGHGLEHVLDDA